MHVIVVGCGRVGSELVALLTQRGHDVTVIDHVGSSFQHLDPKWRARTIEAEPLADGVLQRAGIERADALAAVTNSDAVNAVVAHVARTTFSVPNVVTRNYDPRWRMLHETLGLQVVSSTVWSAQRIEELLESATMRTVLSAGNGEVEVYEMAVPLRWNGKPLSELIDDVACVVAALTRAGRAQLPRPDLSLQLNDLLHIAATLEGAHVLRQRLGIEEA